MPYRITVLHTALFMAEAQETKVGGWNVGRTKLRICKICHTGTGRFEAGKTILLGQQFPGHADGTTDVLLIGSGVDLHMPEVKRGHGDLSAHRLDVCTYT